MHRFRYFRAGGLDEAGHILREQPEAKLLAGGMSLIPSMKLRLSRPPALVDLDAVDGLRGVDVGAGEVTIRAMTTHADVAADPALARAIPALAALAEGIGDPHVRHRGTIGGSLANNDPAADYPAGVLGLGATIATDRREIAADEFFRGLFETALEPDEIIKSVRFPIPERAAYLKFANYASRFAIVGLFLAKFPDRVRVAVTGAGAGVFRVPSIEAALARNFAPDSLDDVEVSARDLVTDVHAPAEYRAHLIRTLARKAVRSCAS